jgi:hypothetical protein
LVGETPFQAGSREAMEEKNRRSTPVTEMSQTQSPSVLELDNLAAPALHGRSSPLPPWRRFSSGAIRTSDGGVVRDELAGHMLMTIDQWCRNGNTARPRN